MRIFLLGLLLSGCGTWDQAAYERALPLGAAIQNASANYAAAVQRPYYQPAPVIYTPPAPVVYNPPTFNNCLIPTR
jgi:hypothetical protein